MNGDQPRYLHTPDMTLPTDILMLLGELRAEVKTIHNLLAQHVAERREDSRRIGELENRVSSLEGKAWGVGMSAKAAWIALVAVAGLALKLFLGV